jgi:hypothetical protein
MATFNGATDSSKPPDMPTVIHETFRRVRDDAPITVSTLAEINLYLTGLTNTDTWLNFVKANMPPDRYTSELQKLQQLINIMPSQYDLLDRTYPLNPVDPVRWCYVSQYTSTPTQTNRQTYIWTDRFTRKVIFTKVGALYSCLRQNKERLLEALPAASQGQYKNLYALAESSLDTWVDTARPFCGFSQDALRQRQQLDRGMGR